MECNRDEATRAKSIAEIKLEKKDFAGAKKFALKAQTLFPGLDGIPQLLTTVDVYISAENKISGEIDWYGVLGVNPSADDETIRKQYRKFALMLHPDKNKSVGAEGAFKLISEAWSLLSDKAKRLVYNQRRGSRGFQQHVSMHNGGSSAPKTTGYYNFANRTASVPKTQTNHVKISPTSTPIPPSQSSETFWTICHRCKMHYEYVKIYLNSTLLCPNCKEAFVASKTAPPFNNSKVNNQFPRRQQQNSSNHVSTYDQVKNGSYSKKSGPEQNPNSGHEHGPKSGSYLSVTNSYRYATNMRDSPSQTANGPSADPSIMAKSATFIQQAQDKLKRTHTESQAYSGWDKYIKKQKVDEDVGRFGMNYNLASGHSGFGTSSATAGSRFSGFPGAYTQSNSTKELTLVETRNMLIVKAKKEIQKKINMWQLEPAYIPANKERNKTKASRKEMPGGNSNFQGQDQNGNSEFSAIKKAESSKKRKVSQASNDVDEEDSSFPPSMIVPDSDFHDFDLDRSESTFGDNEVWAAYDNEDGMPRFYALISKVISRRPFKLKISWLNSKTNSEFSSIDWVGSGFYKTCGEFRVGKYETCKSINAFSQKVSWTKGARGSIIILPKKDDVWALYKNWSSDWNGQTSDEVIHSYDMVVVLEDYSNERGTSVAPLIKVTGFRTVFCPNSCPDVIMRISKEEMLRFSHRVPNYLLTGQEVQDAPRGCLELDPAATPLELLQVAKEADNVLMEVQHKLNEQVLQSPQPQGTSLDKIAGGMDENQTVRVAGKSFEPK